MGFLQQTDNWRETLKEPSYSQIADTKLKALSDAVNFKNSDKQFESYKIYATELHVSSANYLINCNSL